MAKRSHLLACEAPGTPSRFYCVAAQEFGVETEIVQADFTDGRPIYENIAKHLQDKEIGVLGKSWRTVLTP